VAKASATLNTVRASICASRQCIGV
jgi:hypothetical protein